MTHIAIATCQQMPPHEDDDRVLFAALDRVGLEHSLVIWDDADVDWSRFDACLIRTTWDYHEKHDAFVDWVQRIEGVVPLFNDAPTVLWNTHKHYLRDLQARGIPIIDTVWLDAGRTPDLASVVREHGWTHAFIKPAVGATARETLRFEATDTGLDTARRHVERLLPDEDLLLQPYLAAVETEGEWSVIVIDDEITHTIRKIPVPGDYRVQDDFGATDELASLSKSEQDLARRAVAAAGSGLLYARVDFLRDDQGDLRLTELELIEPSLFFRHGPEAADRLAMALASRLE